ncbi:MAG: acetyl-CoA carboxylase [Chloroflexota bacterium]
MAELIRLLAGTSITELEIEDGDVRVSIKREGSARGQAGGPAGADGTERRAGQPDPANQAYVVAPLLGTFYSRPSPTADAFVNVGDRVEKGQVIGLIEAMKIFNEIQAETSGWVRAILAEDGAFVEADQRLISLDTHPSEEHARD